MKSRIIMLMLFVLPHRSENLLSRLKTGMNMMDALKADFVDWMHKNMAIVANSPIMDPKYLNFFEVISKGGKFSKGILLDKDGKNQINEEILQAEMLSISIDDCSKVAVEFPYLLLKARTLKTMRLKNIVLGRNLSLCSELISLEVLELHSCIIGDLFSLLPKGSKLKRLIVHSCTIIPQGWSVENVSNLEELVVNNSDLYQLDKALFMLKKLKKIDLRGNHILELPKFAKNDEFTTEELNLSRNRFSKFPYEVQFFRRLKSLDLGDNLIKKFDKDFPDSTPMPLEKLNLERNMIESVPEILDGLENLKTLNLAQNRLKIGQSSIFQLPSLKDLNLSYNQITFLEEFSSLPSRLIFDRASIHPGVIGMNLKKLNLSYNEFRDLTNSISIFTSLETLDLEGNEFTSIPSVIFSLKKLRSLNVNYNRLMSLPSGLASLYNLYEIKLRGGNSHRNQTKFTNQIHGVPKDLMNQWPNQGVILILTDNPLEKKSTAFSLGEDELRKSYYNRVVL